MPAKLKFISGALFALVVAHDIKAQIKRRKDLAVCNEAFTILTDVNDMLTAECQLRDTKIEYLCHLINEHGVITDEFDLIVLNFNQ